MTDADGRPILDRTDDDGVTSRERIGQNASQLDQLRDASRIAGNPVFGKLLDTLSGLAAPHPSPPVGDADDDPSRP